MTELTKNRRISVFVLPYIVARLFLHKFHESIIYPKDCTDFKSPTRIFLDVGFEINLWWQVFDVNNVPFVHFFGFSSNRWLFSALRQCNITHFAKFIPNSGSKAVVFVKVLVFTSVQWRRPFRFFSFCQNTSQTCLNVICHYFFNDVTKILQTNQFSVKINAKNSCFCCLFWFA